jgi:hypothetical protein
VHRLNHKKIVLKKLNSAVKAVVKAPVVEGILPLFPQLKAI